MCIYIYTPVTDSGTYLSKVYWLLCSEATVHWNKSPSRYVGLYTWATPYSWAARDGCLPMLIGSAPVFPHGNPIFGCWKLQNNHVRLVKIGLGRELVNPIYHHRNLLLKGFLQTPLFSSTNQWEFGTFMFFPSVARFFCGSSEWRWRKIIFWLCIPFLQ